VKSLMDVRMRVTPELDGKIAPIFSGLVPP
jgi:hypothetical protein